MENTLCDYHFVMMSPNSVSLEQRLVNGFCPMKKKRDRQFNINIQYQDFIQEYLNMGHIKKVPQMGLESKSFLLPHHHITQEFSQTKKLRIVFDVSAKSTSSL